MRAACAAPLRPAARCAQTARAIWDRARDGLGPAGRARTAAPARPQRAGAGRGPPGGAAPGRPRRSPARWPRRPGCQNPCPGRRPRRRACATCAPPAATRWSGWRPRRGSARTPSSASPPRLRGRPHTLLGLRQEYALQARHPKRPAVDSRRRAAGPRRDAVRQCCSGAASRWRLPSTPRRASGTWPPGVRRSPQSGTAREAARRLPRTARPAVHARRCDGAEALRAERGLRGRRSGPAERRAAANLPNTSRAPCSATQARSACAARAHRSCRRGPWGRRPGTGRARCGGSPTCRMSPGAPCGSAPAPSHTPG